MGSTYYYYYELDGSVETHDTTLPSTTTCPYLPGQPVNTLVVPVEKTLRDRSASMSSLHQADWTTMRPSDRFVAPRPAPTPTPAASPIQTMVQRLATAFPRPGSSQGGDKRLLRHKTSSRSLSPAPSWRRFFRNFRERDSSRDRASEGSLDNQDQRSENYDRLSGSHSLSLSSSSSVPDLPLASSISRSTVNLPSPMSNMYLPYNEEPHSRCASRQTSRSRDISPESLRRFLVDSSPQTPNTPQERCASQFSVVHPLAHEYQPDVIVTPTDDEAYEASSLCSSINSSVMTSSRPGSSAISRPGSSAISRPVSSWSSLSFVPPVSSSLSTVTAFPLDNETTEVEEESVFAPCSSADVDDDVDLDYNFASPAVPETPSAFTTFLSPPPAAKRVPPVPLAHLHLPESISMTGVLNSPIFSAPASETFPSPDQNATPTQSFNFNFDLPSDGALPSLMADAWGRDCGENGHKKGHKSNMSLSSLSTISASTTDEDVDVQMCGLGVSDNGFSDELFFRRPGPEAQQDGKGPGEMQLASSRDIEWMTNGFNPRDM
ncbi:hypothetical protein CFIMG_001644RA [Ceratocystis fimbriata CBS 114723]|uniref:Uncharacterized protein n=1 Tax=Ceratocystis fimbriata CBS 114723 TaxID=1035309 RepID=A0A2C5XCE2_9PEZI|nr:hypothetical protein CFIMG_001644RA [Ceratocystis fimbriata CBS 114723]